MILQFLWICDMEPQKLIFWFAPSNLVGYMKDFNFNLKKNVPIEFEFSLLTKIVVFSGSFFMWKVISNLTLFEHLRFGWIEINSNLTLLDSFWVLKGRLEVRLFYRVNLFRSTQKEIIGLMLKLITQPLLPVHSEEMNFDWR